MKKSPRLFVRAEARADIRAGTDWYEAERAGLGGEFIRAVRAQLASIARTPQLYAIARGEVRRALMRRFPYVIYYIPDPDQTVVIACLHGRRDPEIWQKRAEDRERDV